MKYSIIIFVLSLVLFTACEKTISITPPQYDSRISIQCMLTPDSLPKLYLGKSVPYFDYAVLPKDLFLADGFVTISSVNGIDTLRPDSLFNDFTCRLDYFYVGKIRTKQNVKYDLKVVVKGQTFVAVTTTNQSKAQLESVGYTKAFNDIYGEHEGVILNIKDIPNEENYYRYTMTRSIDSSTYDNLGRNSKCSNGRFFTVVEIGRTAFDDTSQDGQALVFTIEPAFKHKQGDKGIIRVQTLDRNAAAFFNLIDKQKLAQSNPFVEPVFLKTQIEGCIGIFGSYNVSDSKNFEYPE